jgi:hypothetical protein
MTHPDRGSAARPPPPFAAPLVPRCALTSGATPRMGGLFAHCDGAQSRNASRDSTGEGFAHCDSTEAKAALAAGSGCWFRLCDGAEARNGSRGSRSEGSRRMAAVQHVRGGSPRKRARSEERAEQRTGAGGRRLPRHKAPSEQGRRLPRSGAISSSVPGGSPDPERYRAANLAAPPIRSGSRYSAREPS